MLEVKLVFTGTAPLLMHNERGANVLDPDVIVLKQITSKNSKTYEDYLEMARLEFFLGLYTDAEGTIVVPTRNLWKCVVEGGKLSKLGAKIQRATVILPDYEPLQYDGPKSGEALWALPDRKFVDIRGVVVERKRVQRCRPRFNEWSVSTTIQYDPKAINEADIVTSAENCGAYVGLGDFRPQKTGKMGRFNVEKVR